jgi:hypothetical protein
MIKLNQLPFTGKGTLLLITFLLLFCLCQAQLRIGDRVPDLSFTTMEGKAGRLTDYEGKAILLFFWSPRCSSYGPTIRRADSLQKQFGATVQVLLICEEKEALVRRYFSTDNGSTLALPFITGDTVFRPLFARENYPFTVWLDAQRTIRYFASAYNTTALHLRQFLSGEPVRMRSLAAKIQTAPLWGVNDSLLENQLRFASLLTPCLDGWDVGSGGGEALPGGKAIRYACNCCTALELVKKAFGEGGKYPVNLQYGLALEGVKEEALHPPTDPDRIDVWREANTYNYTLVVPVEKKEDYYSYMQADLQRMLPFSAKLVERKVRGYALVQLAGRKLRSKGGEPFDEYNQGRVKERDTLRFRNLPVKRIYELVESWLSYRYPVENGVKEKGRVDLELTKLALGDASLLSLRKALQKSGLDLRPVWLTRKVLVVSPKKKE